MVAALYYFVEPHEKSKMLPYIELPTDKLIYIKTDSLTRLERTSIKAYKLSMTNRTLIILMFLISSGQLIRGDGGR